MFHIPNYYKTNINTANNLLPLDEPTTLYDFYYPLFPFLRFAIMQYQTEDRKLSHELILSLKARRNEVFELQQ